MCASALASWSSVRAVLGSREQPLSAHHLGCGAVQGWQSHGAAPSISMAMGSLSAAATLAWIGELHAGEGAIDLGRGKSPPDACGEE